jgi:hypothetical protein
MSDIELCIVPSQLAPALDVFLSYSSSLFHLMTYLLIFISLFYLISAVETQCMSKAKEQQPKELTNGAKSSNTLCSMSGSSRARHSYRAGLPRNVSDFSALAELGDRQEARRILPCAST